MTNTYHSIMFSEHAKEAQRQAGSRDHYEKYEGGSPTNAALGPSEAEFIALRDSLYMASIGPTGWPYVQHRGGEQGFVKVLSAKEIGFVEFVGNRQFISRGNLHNDDRVSLIFVDYPNKRRLKLIGNATVLPREDERLAKLAEDGGRGKPDGGILISVVAIEWNCPQFIPPKYSETQVVDMVRPLKQRIAELELALKVATSDG